MLSPSRQPLSSLFLLGNNFNCASMLLYSFRESTARVMGKAEGSHEEIGGMKREKVAFQMA